MTAVILSCHECRHRHDLEAHVYNNLIWDNQDVFCEKCGVKLKAKQRRKESRTETVDPAPKPTEEEEVRYYRDPPWYSKLNYEDNKAGYGFIAILMLATWAINSAESSFAVGLLAFICMALYLSRVDDKD